MSDNELKTVQLTEFDLKRIKEIAEMQGQDPEGLNEHSVWSIVSDALINLKVEVRNRKR